MESTVSDSVFSLPSSPTPPVLHRERERRAGKATHHSKLFDLD